MVGKVGSTGQHRHPAAPIPTTTPPPPPPPPWLLVFIARTAFYVPLLLPGAATCWVIKMLSKGELQMLNVLRLWKIILKKYCLVSTGTGKNTDS